MSQKEKLWERLFHDPYPRDFTYNELMTLLSQMGYVVKQGRGSRIAFGPDPDGIILRLFLRFFRSRIGEQFSFGHPGRHERVGIGTLILPDDITKP